MFVDFGMQHLYQSYRIRRSLLLLVCTFLFMVFALYNGFPIVSGDTEVYIRSGFEGKAAAERPIFYGLFVRATSLGASIWLTMFIQCLIVAFLIIDFIRHIVGKLPGYHLLGLMIIIALGTIAAWYAGQLMPDIFTPVLGLSVFHFIFLRSKTPKTILIVSLIILATLCHFSNQVTLTLTAISGLLLALVFPAACRKILKRSIALFLISIMCWVTLMASNYLSGRGFITSSASHVFLMGKLCESGVLKTYLDKACPIRDYKICSYKEDLPPVAWEFVWDGNSPVAKTGGWEANEKEYKTIIADISSRPKYWPFLFYKSMEATARQIILTNIDEGEERPWVKFEKTDAIYLEIQKRFPHESNLFLTSRQNVKTLNLTFYDDVYIIVLLLSSLFVLFGMTNEIKRTAIPVYAFIMLFLFLNAFATASFGNVLSRLNSRAVWLLPMTNIVFSYLIVLARKVRTD